MCKRTGPGPFNHLSIIRGTVQKENHPISELSQGKRGRWKTPSHGVWWDKMRCFLGWLHLLELCSCRHATASSGAEARRFRPDNEGGRPMCPVPIMIDPIGASDRRVDGWHAGTAVYTLPSWSRSAVMHVWCFSYCCERFGPNRLLPFGGSDDFARAAGEPVCVTILPPGVRSLRLFHFYFSARNSPHVLTRTGRPLWWCVCGCVLLRNRFAGRLGKRGKIKLKIHSTKEIYVQKKTHTSTTNG